MIYLLYTSYCTCFHIIIRNIQYILAKNNIVSTIVHSIDGIEQKVEDVWFCIWNGQSSLPTYNCIIYNMDPMTTNIQSEFNRLLSVSKPQNLLIIDYSYGNNINRVIPYGYSSFHEMLYSHTYGNGDKDIDILFYGYVGSRRVGIIQEVKQFCNMKNYNFVCRNNDLYDEHEKARLVARSKIVLSIPSTDALKHKTNDLARISYLVSNKAFIITEYIGDDEVEHKLDKYICYCNNISEIFDKIDYYLHNDDIRMLKSYKAYTSFKTDFPFETDILSVITSHGSHC